jgi:hypothetical protein
MNETLDNCAFTSQAAPFATECSFAGQMCVLGGGREVPRRTEVRIACSPDARLHFLVREPDFCQYIFVIYSPSLCSLPEYKPAPKPQQNE